MRKFIFVFTLSYVVHAHFSFANEEILGKEFQYQIGPSLKSLNFGVVVNNKNYQIYRSEKLGSAGLKDLKKYLETQSLPFPKTIIYMNKNGYAFPFYFALEEYKEQTKYGFRFYHPFGSIRTYLDGDNPYSPSEDIDTKSILGNEAQKYFELQDDGVDGGVDNFINVLKIVLDPKNQPVLFHCHGGMHRTGMTALALRYMQGGFWLSDSGENKSGISLNMAQLEYTLFNTWLFREDNLNFIEAFTNSDDFIQLAEQYGEIIRDGSESLTSGNIKIK